MSNLNYKNRKCSECMDFRSKIKADDKLDWYVFCGAGRPFACELFKHESQTD